MAIIQIDPIPMQSKGGYPVTITGIDPTDQDCLAGGIVTKGQGLTAAKWNLSGIMRGGTDNSNLNTQTDEFIDVSGLARKLGAASA